MVSLTFNVRKGDWQAPFLTLDVKGTDFPALCEISGRRARAPGQASLNLTVCWAVGVCVVSLWVSRGVPIGSLWSLWFSF